MSKGLKALERNRNFVERYFIKQVEETGVYHKDMKEAIFNDLSTIEKELKALEIIKKHIVNKDLDTSGVYLEYCLGLFEPYYSIEIKRGANQIITEKEYDLLKEVLL